LSVSGLGPDGQEMKLLGTGKRDHMNNSIKKKLLRHLAGAVNKVRKQQDKNSGRFLTPQGGWATYLQDPMYTMALLYTQEGTAWFEKKSLLDTIVKAGDALRDFQDADGRWEFIKPDGSTWGKSYMPWTIYHWLETYALIREYMDASRRKNWERGLQLCYTGLAQEIKEPVAHNVPTWHGMSLVRGSQVFQRPDWGEIGSRQCLFTASHQHKDGYWPEGDGPINGYNAIYTHALGLYYTFTEDKRVLKCLEKACYFLSTFTYPDGTPVETIDGRQNYESNSRYYGWQAFSIFPQGRRLVSLQAQALISNSCDELYPQVASFIHHGTTGSESNLPWQENDRLVYGKKALVRRRGPWFVAASGYSAPADSRTAIGRMRFIMTRSNCFSVWHEALGLLIGGGNSKHDPYFATFDVGDEGARRLEPDKVSFNVTSEGELIRFRYGKHACLLHLRWKSKRVLEFTFELPPSTRRNAIVQSGFTMKLKPGSRLEWQSDGANEIQGKAKLDVQSAASISWETSEAHKKRVIGGQGWSLTMPEESTFYWPIYPFNPYAVDNASPTSHAVAAVSASFVKDSKRTFLLKIH